MEEGNVFDQKGDEIDIMRHSQSIQDNTFVGHPTAGLLRPSPSSMPILTEETSLSNMYSYENGRYTA